MPYYKLPPEVRRTYISGFSMSPNERAELDKLRNLLAARNPDLQMSNSAAIRMAINSALRHVGETDASARREGRRKREMERVAEVATRSWTMQT